MGRGGGRRVVEPDHPPLSVEAPLRGVEAEAPVSARKRAKTEQDASQVASPPSPARRVARTTRSKGEDAGVHVPPQVPQGQARPLSSTVRWALSRTRDDSRRLRPTPPARRERDAPPRARTLFFCTMPTPPDEPRFPASTPLARSPSSTSDPHIPTTRIPRGTSPRRGLKPRPRPRGSPTRATRTTPARGWWTDSGAIREASRDAHPGPLWTAAPMRGAPRARWEVAQVHFPAQGSSCSSRHAHGLRTGDRCSRDSTAGYGPGRTCDARGMPGSRGIRA